MARHGANFPKTARGAPELRITLRSSDAVRRGSHRIASEASASLVEEGTDLTGAMS